MIKNTIGNLAMKTQHDTYSMAAKEAFLANAVEVNGIKYG